MMYTFQLLSEEGAGTGPSWLLFVALGFFLLMVMVGWLTSRRNGEQVDVRNEAHVSHADDLTILEGIGPKVAKILNEAGIHSFSDLERANSDDLQKALDAAGLQMMDPEGWIEQAKFAVKGDMDGLKKLQDELKGGRKAS